MTVPPRSTKRQLPVNPAHPAWTHPLPPGLLTRLERQEGWTPQFTLGAAGEYRRFVYLAVTSPEPITPSRVVDQVWHAHLMFTRDYWETLMPALERPLHHDPGDGTPAQDAAFKAGYLRTLDTYGAAFGPAPAAYWPDPRLKTVTAEQLGYRQPARAPAPPIHRRGAAWIPVLLLLVVPALLLSDLPGGPWLAALVTLGLLTSWWMTRPPQQKRDDRSSGDAGGDDGVAFAADGNPCDSGGSGGGDSGGSSCGGGGCSS